MAPTAPSALQAQAALAAKGTEVELLQQQCQSAEKDVEAKAQENQSLQVTGCRRLPLLPPEQSARAEPFGTGARVGRAVGFVGDA